VEEDSRVHNFQAQVEEGEEGVASKFPQDRTYPEQVVAMPSVVVAFRHLNLVLVA
jgi:hypothetical protein